MNVASKELCQELYKLTGWTSEYYWDYSGDALAAAPEMQGKRVWYVQEGAGYGSTPPAYDLGYLLRKLPPWASFTKEGRYTYIQPEYKYSAQLVNENPVMYASTPEDAACKLAIELFKQGILTKEPHHD